mgnify:CR=1 FL=1|tara:strand:+ start:912 stop:2714 length:1803 start_codon:yes stop_codon:yes gene_type:complete
MAKKKTVPIKYTSRDFNTIRNDLIEYAKRYYADTYKDFSEGSFGSLMIETVAYVGDILSFYLDYQTNESFLDTATEYNNIVRHGRQLGYKFRGSPSAYGECDFYIEVPANSSGLGPNVDYIPLLKQGAAVSSNDGRSFVLIEDVDFNDAKNLTVVGQQNTTTGNPTTYIIKASGRIASGEFGTEEIAVGGFQRFRKLRMEALDVTEIISVFDREGNEYFEVDYLSQDVVYRNVLNSKNSTEANEPAAILKPFSVPRRFTVDRTRRITSLQFGYGSDTEFNKPSVVDPSEVVLSVHGKDYTSDSSFDPTRLLDSDKFGVVPSDTTLVVSYRKNSANSSNASAGSITKVGNFSMTFREMTNTSAASRTAVINSLEASNGEPIVGSSGLPSKEQLRQSIAGSFAAQNRAVTEQDYKAVVYSMPPQFGSVKRCGMYRDSDSFRRNLNLYVISEDRDGYLVQTNNTIKQNLKVWLGQNKPINDTVDILNAKIVNIQIDFTAVSAVGTDKYDIQVNAINRVKEAYKAKMDIGQPFDISQVYNILNKTRGIVDVTKVRVINKFGGEYSSIGYDIRQNTTPDGRYVNVPSNVILEIKFLNTDIKGTIT